MSSHHLAAWLGKTDLNAAAGVKEAGAGPIGQAVKARKFDHVWLLCNYPKDEGNRYAEWFAAHFSVALDIRPVELKDPTDFRGIHGAAVAYLDRLRGKLGKDALFTYHLSPGTPAMAAIWIVLGKTSHPAELIQTSRESGLQTVSLPFKLSAEYLPEILRSAYEEVTQLLKGLPAEAPEFGSIIRECKEMQQAVAEARILAPHDFTVLILGESGTGKELFARAIHAESQRENGPLITINCGAIPETLLESELFGHEKGAFTGAVAQRKGWLECANGGTLFIDEIGDMPVSAQLKLLRFLQEGTFSRVGGNEELHSDVRIIAATHRNLAKRIQDGLFREDFFYRIAIGVLTIPPLRERGADLKLLSEKFLDDINSHGAKAPGWQQKNLSVGANSLIAKHPWLGNVRELVNTLTRAAILTPGGTIDAEHLRRALLPVPGSVSDGENILNRSFGNDLRLPDIMTEVARHYLQRALDETHDNKTEAAKLVGLPSYQTFTNWMRKYGIRE